MPLHIRDDEVDALAEQLKTATGAASKTEAVRNAFTDALKRKRQEVPLLEKIRQLQERARNELGPPDPNFNFKKFRAELWGDED